LDVQHSRLFVVLEVLSCDDLALSEDGLDRLAARLLFNKVDFDGHLSELIDYRAVQVLKGIELMRLLQRAACDDTEFEGGESCGF
jgi:hypothetical protein